MAERRRITNQDNKRLRACLLGKRVCDTVDVDLPDGRATYRVVAIHYQPEAVGRSHG